MKEDKMTIRFAIILLLLATSPCVMAERISFVNLSKQLSNNEIINSPIYTKKVYRQMYEEDKAAYERQMKALDKQKKEGTMSSRTYLYRTEALRNTFKKAYPIPLSEQGQQIEKIPVTMWNLAIFSNHRRHLIRLTHPEYQQIMKDTISGKNLIASENDETQTTSKNIAKQNKNTAIQKIKNTQKLGRKSFSINMDAFK
jgi:hypothetical protein